MRYNTSMCFVSIIPDSVIELVMIVVAAFAFFAAIVIIILFAISKHRDENHDKEIRDLSNSLRIFIVDVPNDAVRYFNSAHLRERKTSSITAFYNQFSSKERENLINWIGNLLDQSTNTPRYLEVNVYIKSSKQSATSILEVQKIDFKKASYLY